MFTPVSRCALLTGAIAGGLLPLPATAADLFVAGTIGEV